MNIRTLAQFCMQVARQELSPSDMSKRLKTDPLDKEAVEKLVKLALRQRVMPIVTSALGDAEWRQAFRDCKIENNGWKGPLHYLTRNMALKAQIKEIDDALLETDTHPILIKGATRLFDELYPSLSMREMADIDFFTNQLSLRSILVKLGYRQVDGKDTQWADESGDAILEPGLHHWAPMGRPQDLVTIEPHKDAVSLMFRHWLPDDFLENLLPVAGCSHFRCLSHRNQLVLYILHMMKQDRDTLEGTLFLRGLLECELMYERLSENERIAFERHFEQIGHKGLITAWRGLARWLFDGDNSARYHSVGAFFLIIETQLRVLGKWVVLLLAFFYRILRLFDIEFWRSGLYLDKFSRMFHRKFWDRLSEMLARAFNVK